MGLVSYDARDGVAVIRLDRPDKRNAISDALLTELAQAVERANADAKVIVLGTNGAHFSAGLDLDEQSRKSTMEGIAGSRSWHALFGRIQRGALPVVASLRGAVIGGGFELASTAHVRVAEPDTFFGMPEGQRGIFVGGGGSVNITRLIGVPRMIDMMLTGRTFNAQDAERMGVVNYLAPTDGGLDMALGLARRIAENAPLSNYATINALQRIHDSGYDEGLFFETMIASLTQSTPEAIERMRDFVEKRGAKVAPPKPRAE